MSDERDEAGDREFADLVAEIDTLRQELADTEADLKRIVDRAEGLAANLHRNTEQIGRLQRENADLESTLKATQQMVVRSDRARIVAEEERDAARAERDELGKALDREHKFEKRHLSDLVDAQRDLEAARAERDAARAVGEDLIRERNRYREHSITLNSVGYRIAETLATDKGADQYVGDPLGQTDLLLAGLESLRTAARHVVDCYRHGNLMGTVVAVDRLGEVLDGGT